MMLASGGGPDDATSFDGEALLGPSVAVKSSGAAAVCAPCERLADGGGATVSFSREWRQEHPETVTDRTSRPAATRGPKTSFGTMPHPPDGRTSSGPVEPRRCLVTRGGLTTCLVSLVVILAQS